MKKRLLWLPLLLLSGQIATAQQWIGVTDAPAHIAFQFPTQAGPVLDDESQLRMYASAVDSLLGLQVHIYDSAYIDPEEPLYRTALEQTQHDSLRAIAKLILLATNSELTSIQDVNINNRAGLEVGIRYMDLASEIPTLTFIRFFLVDRKFITFTISGSQEDMMRLTEYRNAFFNSIAFLP